MTTIWWFRFIGFAMTFVGVACFMLAATITAFGGWIDPDSMKLPMLCSMWGVVLIVFSIGLDLLDER